MSFLDSVNTAGGYDPDNWEAHLDDVIDVDLSDASERRQYENVVIPAGTYRMRIEGGQNRTTDSGYKYISLWMTPVEGEHANQGRVYDSFWLWGDYAPDQKARWKEVRRATGNDETIAGTLREVVNHEVRCKVGVRESKRKGYEGEMENIIRWYRPLRGTNAQAAPAQATTFKAAPTPPTAPQPAAAAAPQAAPVTPSIIAQNQQAVPAQPAPATPQQGTAMPTYSTQQGQPQQAQAQQPVQQPMNQNIQPSEQQQAQDSPF